MPRHARLIWTVYHVKVNSPSFSMQNLEETLSDQSTGLIHSSILEKRSRGSPQVIRGAVKHPFDKFGLFQTW